MLVVQHRSNILMPCVLLVFARTCVCMQVIRMLGRGGELDAAYEVFREMRQSHKVIASNTAITPYI
jgi:pentatricopeptide repeat protein